MISLRIDPKLLERLDRWRENQTVPPQRTAVLTRALERFLDEVESGGDKKPKGGSRP